MNCPGNTPRSTLNEDCCEEEAFDCHCPYCQAELSVPTVLLGGVHDCPGCMMPILVAHNPTYAETLSERLRVKCSSLIDGLTRGLYSAAKREPSVVCAHLIESLLHDVRHKLLDIRDLIETNELCIKHGIALLRGQHIRLRLGEQSIDELKSLEVIGRGTIQALRTLGISTLADLDEDFAAIEEHRDFSAPVLAHIRDCLHGARVNALKHPPRLRSEDPAVKDLVVCLADLKTLGGIENTLRHLEERLQPLVPPRVFISWLGSLMGLVPELDKASLRARLEVVASGRHRIDRIDLRKVASFEELTTSQYIEAIGLLKKRLQDEQSAPSPSASMAEDVPPHCGILADGLLVEQIESLRLVVGAMRNCILREYQEFGAKFILVQKHVLLGDEMGLGKTIQALAAMAHMSGCGKSPLYAIVVAPAGLRQNWYEEVSHKTTLRPTMIAGSGRARLVEDWRSRGGVAIVSYDTLRSDVHEILRNLQRLDIAIADEAQYVKNPKSGRARATRQLFQRAERSLVMTGTPVENNPRELAVILNTVQHPNSLLRAIEAGKPVPAPDKFKSVIQNLYLRRNKEDVIDELPDLIEIEDWLELSSRSLLEHLQLIDKRDGVDTTKHFMGLRQHAIFAGSNGQSVKLLRAQELIEEYRSCGRNVVVFSFFRKVLCSLGGIYPEAFHLNGDVPPQDRNNLIRRFGEFRKPDCGGLLLAQINSGGLGLNIQCASAAIIIEPQLNPAHEIQAICRLHRMGQRSSVNVHRLLTKHTVEHGLYQMLARKRQYMIDYSHDSLLKQQSDSAISNIELTEMLLRQREILASTLTAA